MTIDTAGTVKRLRGLSQVLDSALWREFVPLVDEAADALTEQAASIERAYAILEANGVPRERARNLANGIGVLATRAKRQDQRVERLTAQVAALEAERKQARKFLIGYADHKASCSFMRGVSSEGFCDCGFSALLATLSASEGT